jgi:tRNA (Thr-GGU) A37 N-methylase
LVDVCPSGRRGRVAWSLPMRAVRQLGSAAGGGHAWAARRATGGCMSRRSPTRPGRVGLALVDLTDEDRDVLVVEVGRLELPQSGV